MGGHGSEKIKTAKQPTLLKGEVLATWLDWTTMNRDSEQNKLRATVEM